MDYQNSMIGNFRVLDLVDNEKYLCMCGMCGKETYKTQKALKVAKSRYKTSGHETSCGCSKYNGFKQNNEMKFEDLSNKQFGSLTVIELGPTIEVGSTKKKRRTWKCKCSCGQVIYVTTDDLVSGNTKSCGCLISSGEKQVSEELTKRNIGFIREYSFDDLVSEKGFPLRFDFAITNADKLLCLIEYQGEQHYKDFGYFGKQQREITDKQKKEYCDEHHIPLFEISYTDNIKDKIEQVMQYVYDNTVPRTVDNS